MNVVHRIENWGDSHHPRVLDIVRIALGAFLLLKGIAFMQNTEYLKAIIIDQDVINLSNGLLMALVYYVAFAHMVGGVLIGVGILTRFGCIIQIPIVVGAILLSGIFEDAVNYMVWPSVAALIALVIFLILGSGPWSLDRYLGGLGSSSEE